MNGKPFLMIAAVLSLTTACTGRKPVSAPTPSPTPAESNTPTAVQSTAPSVQPAVTAGLGLYTEEDVYAYLEGDWEMMPYGYMHEKPYTYFSFFPDGTFSVNHEKKRDMAAGSFTVSELSPDQERMKITVAPSSFDAELLPGDEALLHTTADFEIFAAKMNGMKLLALREAGNGESLFARDALLYAVQSDDRFWIFRQPQDTGTASAQVKKDSQFYAMQWLKEDGTVWLQEVETEQYEAALYDKPVPVIEIGYMHNDDALDAVPYELAFGGVEDVFDGVIRPQFVHAETNAKGQVVRLHRMPYETLGLYGTGSEQTYPSMPLHIHRAADVEEPADYDCVSLDTGEYAEWVLFETDTEVHDVKLLRLTVREITADGQIVFDAETAYEQDTLKPDKPLAAEYVQAGDRPSLGISYRDAAGSVRYFAMYVSGMDGSLSLGEYKPE